MVIKISMPTDEPVDFSWLITLAKRKKVLGAISGVLAQLQSLNKEASSGTLRRSVMGFDQLNRLNAPSGRKAEENPIVKLMEFLDSSRSWESLERIAELTDAFRQRLMGTADATDILSGNMEEVAFKGSWMARALDMVGNSAVATSARFGEFYRYLRDMVRQMLEVESSSGAVGEAIKRVWGGLGSWFNGTVYAPIRADIDSLWDGLEPEARQSLQAVKSLFRDAGQELSLSFTAAWNSVESAFSGGGTVFEGLTEGVLKGFKSMVNGLISGINQVVVKPFSGINELFAGLKNFSIGSLKPFKNLTFSIPMPQIPYLAQGAVLPANKPFMAVVGDQKHGTNIEAPLDVIRQAMAEVMAESVDAQLAGHSATVELLKQILEAVLGISLDDAAVARAVERHQQRLAVMTGGF